MQVTKVILIALAILGLFGAPIAVKVLLEVLILGVSRKHFLIKKRFFHTKLGFAFVAATGLFALMITIICFSFAEATVVFILTFLLALASFFFFSLIYGLI